MRGRGCEELRSAIRHCVQSSAIRDCLQAENPSGLASSPNRPFEQLISPSSANNIYIDPPLFTPSRAFELGEPRNLRFDASSRNERSPLPPFEESLTVLESDCHEESLAAAVTASAVLGAIKATELDSVAIRSNRRQRKPEEAIEAASAPAVHMPLSAKIKPAAKSTEALAKAGGNGGGISASQPDVQRGQIAPTSSPTMACTPTIPYTPTMSYRYTPKVACTPSTSSSSSPTSVQLGCGLADGSMGALQGEQLRDKAEAANSTDSEKHGREMAPQVEEAREQAMEGRGRPRTGEEVREKPEAEATPPWKVEEGREQAMEGRGRPREAEATPPSVATPSKLPSTTEVSMASMEASMASELMEASMASRPAVNERGAVGTTEGRAVQAPRAMTPRAHAPTLCLLVALVLLVAAASVYGVGLATHVGHAVGWLWRVSLLPCRPQPHLPHPHLPPPPPPTAARAALLHLHAASLEPAAALAFARRSWAAAPLCGVACGAASAADRVPKLLARLGRELRAAGGEQGAPSRRWAAPPAREGDGVVSRLCVSCARARAHRVGGRAMRPPAAVA